MVTNTNTTEQLVLELTGMRKRIAEVIRKSPYPYSQTEAKLSTDIANELYRAGIVALARRNPEDGVPFLRMARDEYVNALKLAEDKSSSDQRFVDEFYKDRKSGGIKL